MTSLARKHRMEQAAMQAPVWPEDEGEISRALAEQRRFAAANRERIDAEWDALTCPPRTIEGHLAEREKRNGS